MSLSSWGGYSWPSIHFRHREKANIVWADGHVSSHKSNGFTLAIYDGIDAASVNLGWFGPIDNSLFDLD